MLNLGPCSILPPHLHARGTNYVVAVHGNTTTYMYEENGARLVTQALTPGQATIFPQASMHMMVNTGMSLVCLSAWVFVTFDTVRELYGCDGEGGGMVLRDTGTAQRTHFPHPSSLPTPTKPTKPTKPD
jgi:hypothetical protein